MANLYRQLPDGTITSPAGFQAGATFAGFKVPGPGKLDLGALYSTTSCTAAGVFTTNLVRAAPVSLCEERLSQGGAQAILVNSGCANACTGEEGMANARLSSTLLGQQLGLDASKVLVASTGVIGVQLDMGKMRSGLDRLRLRPDGGHDLARAIITTDTHPKEVAVTFEVGGALVTLGGIAKGAGIIHPNMATMLGFITTDAALDIGVLRPALKRAADLSFNMITIDGDTSTNDTLIVLANGSSGVAITPGSPAMESFEASLQEICRFLARSIAADGEGATRLIEVTVSGAVSEADARVAARTVAGSNLVKSAVHGADPNWGRILAAAGRSGARLVENKVDVQLGDVLVMRSGRPFAFDEAAASSALKGKVVSIAVDLKLGDYSSVAWGCDLSEEYVSFNSEYTT